MRKVGEGGFNKIPTKNVTREVYRANKKRFYTKVLTACSDCKAEFNIKEATVRWLYRTGGEFVCVECREKGKNEMNAALIALAKRKGLI